MINYSPLKLADFKTEYGINILNSMLRFLYDAMAGDGETTKIYYGIGTPEGTVSAGIGSIYLRKDGGADTSVYRKESGTGATGWIAMADPIIAFTDLTDTFADYTGLAGQYLKVKATEDGLETGAIGTNFSAVRVYASADFTQGAAWATISDHFDTVDWDLNGEWSVANDQFQPIANGYYHVHVHLSGKTASSGNFRIYIDGVVTAGHYKLVADDYAGYKGVLDDVYYLTTANVLKLYGHTVNGLAGSNYTFMNITRVG